MTLELPCAEEINYWKTSRTGADAWLEKTVKLIEDFGGQVLEEYYGTDRTSGRSAYKLVFRLGSDTFDLVWPVLPSKTNDTAAAKRQAATMIYHRVKANLLHAKIFGARAAFFEFLLLPDGRTAAQASNDELVKALPGRLAQTNPLLVEGEIIDGQDIR